MSAGNSFGTILKLTLFGESHGEAIGAVIDGFPSQQSVPFHLIEEMIGQRQPAGEQYETSRFETDKVEFLSGIHQEKTLGTPIAFLIRNTDVNPADYQNLHGAFRPGHADYSYYKKYGVLSASGGGRASGRETVARVVAGAFALDFLNQKGIEILSFVSAIGPVTMALTDTFPHADAIKKSRVRCPDEQASKEMEAFLKQVSAGKNSIGGQITTMARGVPAGLGEPVFNKLSARLAQAVFSIPSCRGVWFGDNLVGKEITGIEYNDAMIEESNGPGFASNHSGGIIGGISNGNVLKMHSVFRPASSVGLAQQTVDASGKQAQIVVSGRHDACFVPRAAVVVTSMAAVTIMDLFLQQMMYESEKLL